MGSTISELSLLSFGSFHPEMGQTYIPWAPFQVSPLPQEVELPSLCLSLRPAGVVGLDARLGNVGVIPRAMETGHLDDEGHW